MFPTDSLDFVIVVGKGGVGKTTVSAALAMAARKRGKRVLIAMCNGKERLSRLLGVAPVGPRNQTVLPGIDAVNMTPTASLEEYGLMILKVRALYRAVFENRFATAFLHATPGLEAWAMLGKAYFHASETLSDGSRRYDQVIFDAPATGHGLDMLRVPQVIVDVAPPGLLRREAEQALQLFRDPRRSGVALVTLPEDMPVNETIELHQALKYELRFPVAALVANGVLPRLFEEPQSAFVESIAAKSGASEWASVIATAARRVLRERSQRHELERLRAAIDAPFFELPRIFAPSFARAQVEQLAARLV